MKKTVGIFLMALFVLSSTSLNADNNKEEVIKSNSIIIKFHNDVVADNNLENQIENTIDENVKNIDTLNDESNVGDIVEVETKSEMYVVQAIEDLEKRSDVEYVQPNYIYKALEYSSNASCSSPWHLQSNYLNAASAKSKLSSGTNVTVGIVDSGVKGSHSELSAVFNSSLSYDFIKNRKAQVDENGHGTHVAGTVAGKTVGVGTKIKIVSYRVLNGNGEGTTAAIVKAVNKANKDGVRVLNMSLGADQNDKLLYNAIAKYNGIVVAAAGNESDSNANYPARYNLDNIIAVGAMTKTNYITSYSNYHATNVDLFTYGSSILSSNAFSSSACISQSGTSMATPIVSASVAMNKSYNSNASNQQIKASIMDGTKYASTLSKYSASKGYLDLNRGLNIVKTTHFSNVNNDRNGAKHAASKTSTSFILSGTNDYGQLGNSEAQPFEASQVSKYYLTRKNTYVITNDGRLFVAGANDYGQLGNTALGNTNKFVEFPRLSTTHKFVGIDFRNNLGMYNETSIYLYLKYGKNTEYYKLGTSSFKANSNSKVTTKNIQYVKYENNLKKEIKYYNNAKAVITSEKYSYNSSSSDIASKTINYSFSTYNRKLSYSYSNGTIKKYSKLDTTKAGKRKLYFVQTYKVKKKSAYKYYSVIATKSQTKYNNGVITGKYAYSYNKYGKLKYKNKSNAKYTKYVYKNGLAISTKTYKYKSNGKKRLSYERKNSYSKRLLKLKKEYYYNSKGKLKEGAYYYKTTYKKGKAKKTYKYLYNKNGKLTNKKVVKTRK
ncbi:subtilisin family serine protease [Bacilli bacterium PM5-9]|nr:subtilisin family serine protease [Bacilli bacterium PM5-9]